MSHTKGTWKINKVMMDATGKLVIVSDTGENGIHVAEVTVRKSGFTDEQLANARLIEAAPTMMAMLESLVFVAESAAHLRGLEKELLPTTDAARSLIAKIKGE